MTGLATLLESAHDAAHASFVERKSEFIGDACHVSNLGEALDFVELIRARHPKSRHVAYAAVCGGTDGHLAERMSDDGEPSGTAGKPILDVIRAHGLTDCVVTVTRYFGGILLGSGGLIRAYASGAAQAIKAAQRVPIVACTRYGIVVEYGQLGPLRRLLLSVGAETDASEYADKVSLEVLVPQSAARSFETRLRELFQATVDACPLGVASLVRP